jgi:HK97 family phage prohead protease
MNVEGGRLPTITELPDPVDGDGLLVSGYFATWQTDSEEERFARHAFDQSLPAFLRGGNPVALWNHRKGEAPIGRVTAAELRRDGLYGSILVPRPMAGTKSFELYSAIKSKLVNGFSVSGLFDKFRDTAGNVNIICRRIFEVSLTPCPVGASAVADSVVSVSGAKCIDGEWRTNESEALQDAVTGLALTDVRLKVAAMLMHRL